MQHATCDRLNDDNVTSCGHALAVPVEHTSCVVPRSGNVSPNVDADRIKLEINLIKSSLISLL